jgi:uncharacterized damage-inducible protein DinB
MTPEGTSEIVHILENSRQEFNAATSGLSESHANARPEVGRWSVLECVEHVAIVEERFLGWLERAEPREAPPIDKQKEAALAVRVTNRANRAEAPAAVRPTGRFTSLPQGLEHFNTTRTRTIRFAEERSDDLYCLASEHPRFGRINGTELLLIIAGHARRHADQIREIRAALGKS